MTMGLSGYMQPQATSSTLGPRGKPGPIAMGSSLSGGGGPSAGNVVPTGAPTGPQTTTNSGLPGQPQTINGVPVPGSGVITGGPNANPGGANALGDTNAAPGAVSNNIFGNGASGANQNYNVPTLSSLAGGATSAQTQGNPRAEYGSSNSANEAAQFWQQQGASAAAGLQNAPTIGTAAGMSGLAATAAGQGPVANAVQGQYGQNLGQAMQAQAAAAASARGGGAGLAAAKQGAMQQQQQLAGQAGQQAGTTMAQDALTAQGQYAQLGQQQATAQAQLQQQGQQSAAQAGLNYAQLAQQTEQGQLSADTSTYGANLGLAEGAAANSAQQTNSLISGGTALAGAGLAAMML